MALWRKAGLTALLITATLSAQGVAPAPNVDFRNFSFPFPDAKFLPVPDKMTWMSMNMAHTVTLTNGRYDFGKTDPASGPSLILDQVLYGYLTSSKQLDA